MRDAKDENGETISDDKLQLDLERAIRRATIALEQRALRADYEKQGELIFDVEDESVLVH